MQRKLHFQLMTTTIMMMIVMLITMMTMTILMMMMMIAMITMTMVIMSMMMMLVMMLVTTMMALVVMMMMMMMTIPLRALDSKTKSIQATSLPACFIDFFSSDIVIITSIVVVFIFSDADGDKAWLIGWLSNISSGIKLSVKKK